jgi:hypothetical protein
MGLLLILLACNKPQEESKPRVERESPPEDSVPPLDSTPTIDSHIEDPPASYTGPARVLVATGSGLTLVDPADNSSHSVAIDGWSPILDIDCAGDSIWVMTWNQDTVDTVIRIDPINYTVVSTWDLGSYWRGSGVIRVGAQWWLTSWGKNTVVIADDSGPTGTTFSLEEFADADKLPEIEGGLLVTDTDGSQKVYLAATRFGQVDGIYYGAKLIEVDPSSYATRSIDLARTYPDSVLNHVASDQGSSLYVSYRSTTGNEDGGVERVDLGTFTSAGLLVDDQGQNRYVDANGFDTADVGIWRAYRDSDGLVYGQNWTFDGSAGNSFRLNAQIPAIDTIGGNVLYVAENGFDGTSAIVVRKSLGGEETARIGMPARIVASRICE